MTDDVPMSIDELERMRLILRKSNTLKQDLTPDEEKELRGYVVRSRPEAANTDLANLILIGLFLLGLYVTILLADAKMAESRMVES
jgi:hypothetical protein